MIYNIEDYFTKCDFEDDCDQCNAPENGTYAVNYNNLTGEVDSYICGKCALIAIPKIIQEQEEIENKLSPFTRKLYRAFGK